MFSLEQFLGFGLASLICIIAPGPDNLSILGLGLSRGRSAGMGYALGCALGCLTHTLWATLGVSAIVAASEVAFSSFKFAGAGYLFYLGIMALRSGGSKVSDVKNNKQPKESFFVFVRRGLIGNAINPKVALFFLAFLPQFVNSHGNVSGQMALFGILFSLMTGCLFLVLGYFSGTLGAWLNKRAKVGLWLDRLTGGLFIGLGFRLMFSEKGAV